MPPSVQELVPAGHLAHSVRDLVREGLDLSGILAEYREERGYPRYHPVIMVALDGTKVQANASRHKAMSYARMKEREAQLAAEVAKWFEEAAGTPCSCA